MAENIRDVNSFVEDVSLGIQLKKRRCKWKVSGRRCITILENLNRNGYCHYHFKIIRLRRDDNKWQGLLLKKYEQRRYRKNKEIEKLHKKVFTKS